MWKILTIHWIMTDQRTWRYNSINKVNNESIGFVQDSIGGLSIGGIAANNRNRRRGCNQQQLLPQPTLVLRPTAPQPTAPPTPQQPPPYSADGLRYEGLLLCGFTEKRITKVKQERNEIRFWGNYGVSSVAISKVVNDLLHEKVIKDFSIQ